MTVSDLEQQIRRLVDSGTISDHQAIQFILASQAELLAGYREMQKLFGAHIQSADKRMDLLEQRVRSLESYAKTHPSLLWLLRYDTRRTVAFIVLVFMALSLWFISGFRQPILDWLGLPIF